MRILTKIFLPILLMCIFAFEADAQKYSHYNNNAKEESESEVKSKSVEEVKVERYKSIKDSRDLKLYFSFIMDYPKDEALTPEIRNRVKEMILWKTAKKKNEKESYEKYLKQTKYGWYKSEANEKLKIVKK
ncbi:MAG: hypothetical protein SPG50_02155 [Muribaculaceae bacterium]|nr:hypothetical protein [Bacteroidales bacterium]MDY5387412.1 hypothetical protein [Muribaculaceae bacterium]